MKIEDVIGQRIADVRDTNKITQQQLADQIGELLGKTWSRQAVWSAEKGARAFTAVELIAFAHVLGVPVDRLLMPPTSVRTIDLPGGKQLDRSEIGKAALPRMSARTVFESMHETLRTLAQASQARTEYERIELEAIDGLYKQMELAAQAYLHENEEESSDGESEDPADSGR